MWLDPCSSYTMTAKSVPVDRRSWGGERWDASPGWMDWATKLCHAASQPNGTGRYLPLHNKGKMTDCMSRIPLMYLIFHHHFRTALALHFLPLAGDQTIWRRRNRFSEITPWICFQSNFNTSVKSLPAKEKFLIYTSMRMIPFPLPGVHSHRHRPWLPHLLYLVILHWTQNKTSPMCTQATAMSISLQVWNPTLAVLINHQEGALRGSTEIGVMELKNRKEKTCSGY